MSRPPIASRRLKAGKVSSVKRIAGLLEDILSQAGGKDVLQKAAESNSRWKVKFCEEIGK